MAACKAASVNDVSKLRSLAEKGVDLNGGDYDARTPLHIAAGAGNLEAVKYLLETKVQVNPVDRWGATPMNDGVNYLEIRKLFESYGGKMGMVTPYYKPLRIYASDN